MVRVFGLKVNREQDRKRWEKEVDMELAEMKEEHQITVVEPYEESLKKYKTKLQVNVFLSVFF